MTQFLWDNIHLVGLMVVSGALLVWPSISALLSGARQISTLDATRLMNQGNGLVLDVREPAEFAAGRVPKSKNVPLAELAKRVDEIGRFKDKPVIVTCATGSRGGAALRQLKSAGFTDLYCLRGGLAAWRDASLPIEK